MHPNKMFVKTVFFTLLTALFTFNASSTMADESDSEWAKKHPRREEVNGRLANQNRRIHKEVKEGDLTKSQAQQLHQEDRSIRKQERVDASQHHGHITKTEQKQLNQEENSVSKQIGQ
jgi:hypothetical protein